MNVPAVSCSPEKDSTMCSTSKRKRVIEELVHGRDSATQLQLLLRQDTSSSVSDPHELVLNILKSFTHTLSVLTSGSSSEDQSPAISPVGSACCDDRRSQDSGGNSGKRPDKRGCYKRRKNLQTWTTVTPSTDDGQAWRKYGQKDILNAKYPRAYFRCTRKHDQGCRATKQVQQMEDDSQMYKTTYIGLHTCRDMIKTPPVVTHLSDPIPIWDSYNAINSSDNHSNRLPTSDEPRPLSCRVNIKEESKESDLDSPTKECYSDNVGAMIESIMWPDLLSFDSSEVVSMVYSCTDTTSQNLDNIVDFDSTDFNFDENEFA